MWLKLYFCVRVNTRTLVQDLLHSVHEFSHTVWCGRNQNAVEQENSPSSEGRACSQAGHPHCGGLCDLGLPSTAHAQSLAVISKTDQMKAIPNANWNGWQSFPCEWMGLSLILAPDFDKAGTIKVSSKPFSCMNILYNLRKLHHLPFEFCFLAVKSSIFPSSVTWASLQQQLHYYLQDSHMIQESSTFRGTAEKFIKEDTSSSPKK